MSLPAPGSKAVLYARFSPRPGADECQSAAKQLEKLREWAQTNGIHIKAEYKDEAVSGTFTKSGDLPPAMAEAVLTLNAGDYFVGLNVSRISRDGGLLAFLDRAVKRRGAHMYVIDEKLSLDDPDQAFLFKLLCLFYERDRERQRELCRAARRKKLKDGTYHPPVPRFGYTSKRDSRGWVMEENPLEQVILRRMIELREAGWKLKEVADQLNQEGYRKRHGGEWAAWSVSEVLIKHKDKGWPLGLFNEKMMIPSDGSEKAFGSDWEEDLPDRE